MGPIRRKNPITIWASRIKWKKYLQNKEKIIMTIRPHKNKDDFSRSGPRFCLFLFPKWFLELEKIIQHRVFHMIQIFFLFFFITSLLFWVVYRKQNWTLVIPFTRNLTKQQIMVSVHSSVSASERLNLNKFNVMFACIIQPCYFKLHKKGINTRRNITQWTSRAQQTEHKSD